MAAAGVPTAMAHVCDTEDEAAEALDAFGPPYVVKDDGLAAGKGVVVTDDRDVALAHAAACGRVVIEEYLDGPEVSLFAICDGTHVLPMQPAQDFKRLGDGDRGPNTGGMGAYTPLPWAPPGLVDDVVARVIQPAVDELRRRGAPFVGLLYAGLALTSRGHFGWSSSTPGSATRRRSRCSSCSRRRLGQVLYAAATGRPGRGRTAALASRRRGVRRDGGGGIPGVAAQGRRDHRRRRGRGVRECRCSRLGLPPTATSW